MYQMWYEILVQAKAMQNVECPIMRHHKCLQLSARKTTSDFTTKFFPLTHRINLNPSTTSLFLPVSEQNQLPHARFLSLTLNDGSISHTFTVLGTRQITISRYLRPQDSRGFGDLECLAFGEYHFLFIFAAGWRLDILPHLPTNAHYLTSTDQKKYAVPE